MHQTFSQRSVGVMSEAETKVRHEAEAETGEKGIPAQPEAAVSGPYTFLLLFFFCMYVCMY